MKLIDIRVSMVCAAFAGASVVGWAANAKGSGGEVLEEITVTGSRLASSGFDTPTPVTTIDAAALAATVPNDVGEALSQLPSLLGSTKGNTSGMGSVGTQTNGQTLLNLRSMGSSRTLVLLDGLRLGVTNVVGSVDTNIIPQTLIKRVDVVTGGASASYGSDAVAGVVNFILDTQFEGLKAEANYGQTRYSDNQNGKVSLAFGKHINDRLRVVGSAEYYRNHGMSWGDDVGRDWHTNPTTAVANAPGQQPSWLLIPDARSHYATFGGTITNVYSGVSGAAACTAPGCQGLLNQHFLGDGSLAPMIAGMNVIGKNAFVSGGSGSVVNQSFSPSRVERYGAFLHGEFDLADRVTLWSEGGYNANETFNQAQVFQMQDNNQPRIMEDNAFLPDAVRATLAAVPGMQSFNLTRNARDMGFNEVTGSDYVTRLALGAKGSVTDRWSFDTAAAYQDTHQDLDARAANMRNFFAAVDAVVQPDSGEIVCRSQWYQGNAFMPQGTGLDPGCAPLNLFGDGAASAAATQFVMGLDWANISLKQATFDFNLRGDLGERLSLGAGPIRIAAGVNYRNLTADRDVEPLSVAIKDATNVRGFSNIAGSTGAFSYYNPTPFKGSTNAKEGYLELGIPLLRDLPGVKNLSTTLAGRLTDYSQSGIENTWKWGLNWTVNSSLRVRGTISADARAPSVIELFDAGTATRGTYSLPPDNRLGVGVTISKGNAALAPEHARTYTAGFVVSPSALPGFQASLDWYKIQLLDSISSAGPQGTVDRCYAGDQSYCAGITIDGSAVTTIPSSVTNANFIQVISTLRNFPSDVYTSGLDLAAAYRIQAGPGTLDLQLLGQFLLQQYNPNSSCAAGSLGRATDFVGVISTECGAFPRIRSTLSARYDIGNFGIYAQERYIGGGELNPNYVTGVDISNNDIPSIMYTDLTLTYRVSDVLNGDGEVYLNALNLLDKDPPPTNSGRGRTWIDPTIMSLYDVFGQRFVVGVRFRL